MGGARERCEAVTPVSSRWDAITTSVEEKHLRLEAQAQEMATEEAERRQEEAQWRQEAETLAREEAERRREAEAELERLRAQLANRQDEGA